MKGILKSNIKTFCCMPTVINRNGTFISAFLVFVVIISILSGIISPISAEVPTGGIKRGVERAQTLDKVVSKVKVLYVIPPGNFQDKELFETKEYLESKKNESTIASTDTVEFTGIEGGKITPDILLSKIDSKDYKAIIFIGGTGAKALFDNEDAHKLVVDFAKENKIVAAICLAPVILARAGILKNIRATVSPFGKEELIKGGARYVDKDVVTNRRFITAKGPDATQPFAKAIEKKIAQEMFSPRIHKSIMPVE